jgi:amino acid transporter
MILTARRLVDPDFTVHYWQIYLLFLLLTISQSVLVALTTKILGRINIVGAVVNLIALVLFVFWMPLGSINTPKTNSTSFAWSEIANGTEWPNGFAVLMSSVAVIYTMAGYDAPFHLSEECSNANIAVPRAICLTGLLGLVLGFPIILVIA